MITAVNVRDCDVLYDIYAGRPAKGKMSPLGNRFTVEEYGREGAIERYRHWLWREIKGQSPHTMEALIEILDFEQLHGDVSVGCWCKPKPCHVDVIINALRNEKVLNLINEYRATNGLVTNAFSF